MVNVLDDLALAHRIADEADALTLARFRASDLRIDHKADHSEVTDADLAVEDAETHRRGSPTRRCRPR